MLINKETNIERIIAKIDNDFNPDNSDWIPRVAVWAIEVMQQLNVLPTERKKKKLKVSDRIAYSPCEINENTLKVYDENGCEINKASNDNFNSKCCPTGEVNKSTTIETVCSGYTTNKVNINNSSNNSDYIFAETINTKDYNSRYNVIGYSSKNSNNNSRNYTIVDCDKIEINYDADYIYIEYDCVKTVPSSIYRCEVPVIPNNAILIEAIAYYCAYKMLCRGYKHPVFNLGASQYGTNPYYQWTQLKEEAKRSVLNNNINDDTSKLFRSNFFIETFDPRG